MSGDRAATANLPVTFAARERYVSAAVLAACGLGGLPIAFESDASGLQTGAVLITTLGFLVAAYGEFRRYTVFGTSSIVDVGGFRTRTIPWDQVRSVDIARPRGVLDGFCLCATRLDGSELNLAGTRVYSRLPDARGVTDLRTLLHRLTASPGADGH